MGSGCDRVWGTEAGADAAVESSEGGIAVGERLSPHTKGVGRPVYRFPCFRALDLSSGNAVIRAESEPGNKSLFSGKLRRVETNLGDNRLRGKGIEARYLT